MTDPILINFETLVNVALHPFVKDNTVKARVFWNDDGFVQIVFKKAGDLKYLGVSNSQKRLSNIIVDCAKALNKGLRGVQVRYMKNQNLEPISRVPVEWPYYLEI